jgi:hypothetical protein
MNLRICTPLAAELSIPSPLVAEGRIQQRLA